jgi:DNA-binding NarL/FixJ family response regulator
MVYTTRPIDNCTRQKVVEKKEAGLFNGVIAEHLGISISSVK